MTTSIQSLVRDARNHKPDALIGLLGHSKVKEIMRVRAHKMGGFPFSTNAERRSDCQTHLWEIVEAQKDERIEELKRDSEWLPYLSFALRNRLFGQVRSEQKLREVEVEDEGTGKTRFELQPKIVRADFELALAQVDTLADPLYVLGAKEAIRELQRAVRSASTPTAARQALRLSMSGLTGSEVAGRMDRTSSAVYALLEVARQAVRERLRAIRFGGAR
ncbi:MAG: hypothetical protein HY814_07075 [Candidatus Riflebacteria bacterium]|nr:hypothetical protein [Candidatus Riflebacteria bacterium]